MAETTQQGGRAIARAAMFAGCLLAAGEARADRGDQEVSVAAVPLNVAWYIGSVPSFPDGKIDQTSATGLGATAAYLVGLSRHWEFGPRLTVVKPTIPESLIDASLTFAMRTTWRFAGGHGRWSLGIHGGENLSLLDSNTRYTSTGLILGPEVGVRWHLRSRLWLVFEAAIDLTIGGDREYSQDIWRIGSLGVGLALGPELRSEPPEERPVVRADDVTRSRWAFLSGVLLGLPTKVPLPVFGARYGQQLRGGLQLDVEAATDVIYSTAQGGVSLELTSGWARPYGFGHAGATLGLEDDFEVRLLGLGGLGIALGRPSGRYWFLELGGGVTAQVRGNNNEVVTPLLQISAGIGARRTAPAGT